MSDRNRRIIEEFRSSCSAVRTASPGFDGYEQRTTRTIPVLRLTRV